MKVVALATAAVLLASASVAMAMPPVTSPIQPPLSAPPLNIPPLTANVQTRAQTGRIAATALTFDQAVVRVSTTWNDRQCRLTQTLTFGDSMEKRVVRLHPKQIASFASSGTRRVVARCKTNPATGQRYKCIRTTITPNKNKPRKNLRSEVADYVYLGLQNSTNTDRPKLEKLRNAAKLGCPDPKAV